MVTGTGDRPIAIPHLCTPRSEHPCREVTAYRWRVDMGGTITETLLEHRPRGRLPREPLRLDSARRSPPSSHR